MAISDYTNMAALKKQAVEFQNPIGPLMNLSGRNVRRTIQFNENLRSLIKALCQPHGIFCFFSLAVPFFALSVYLFNIFFSLVHRIFVVNEAGDTVGLMSQSRVLEFLLKHKDRLSPEKLNYPIEKFSKKVCFEIFYFCFDLLIFHVGSNNDWSK
jgi:hypothetical protein